MFYRYYFFILVINDIFDNKKKDNMMSKCKNLNEEIIFVINSIFDDFEGLFIIYMEIISIFYF